MKGYAWNPSLCARRWDKDREIDEYLIACDEIVDTPESVNEFLQ